MVLKSLLILLSCALVTSHPFDFGEILKGIQGAESGDSNNQETPFDINKVLENAQGDGSGDGIFAENTFDITKLLENAKGGGTGNVNIPGNPFDITKLLENAQGGGDGNVNIPGNLFDITDTTKLLESIQKLEDGNSDFTDISEDISSITNGFASNVLPDSYINAIQKASEVGEAVNLLIDLPDKNILNIPEDKLVEFDDSHTTAITNIIAENNFKNLDTNNDKRITEEDGINSRIFEVLLQGDLNGDGKINMKEYVTKIHNFRPDKSIVNIMDKNSDGFLEDFELVLSPAILNSQVWDFVLDQMDTSDDNRLSVKEYLNFLYPSDTEPNHVQSNHQFCNPKKTSTESWVDFVLAQKPSTCKDVNGTKKYCESDSCHVVSGDSGLDSHCGLKEVKKGDKIEIVEDAASKTSPFSGDVDTDITIEMTSFIPKNTGKPKTLLTLGAPSISVNPLDWIGVKNTLENKRWVRGPPIFGHLGTIWIATDEKRADGKDGEGTLKTTIKVSTANFGNEKQILDASRDIDRESSEAITWITIRDSVPTTWSFFDGPDIREHNENDEHTWPKTKDKEYTKDPAYIDLSDFLVTTKDECSATFDVSSAKDFPLPYLQSSLRPYARHNAIISILRHGNGYSVKVEGSHSEEFAFELKINGQVYEEASCNKYNKETLEGMDYKLFHKRHECFKNGGSEEECHKLTAFSTTIHTFKGSEYGANFMCGRPWYLHQKIG